MGQIAGAVILLIICIAIGLYLLSGLILSLAMYLIQDKNSKNKVSIWKIILKSYGITLIAYILFIGWNYIHFYLKGL